MDKSEKISWFEQFKIACLKPSQYKRLLNLAKGKVILFLAAITLITTILGYGMDVAGFTVSVGGWKNFILNRLPAFELKDGTLSVDQEMDFEIGGVHFVADTSKDKVSTEDLSNKYQMELVFAKNEMVVKNTAVGNMMNTFSFKNMKNVEFNNQAMLSMVPMIRIFIVIMFFTRPESAPFSSSGTLRKDFLHVFEAGSYGDRTAPFPRRVHLCPVFPPPPGNRCRA